jgi:hypothetical protein
MEEAAEGADCIRSPDDSIGGRDVGMSSRIAYLLWFDEILAERMVGGESRPGCPERFFTVLFSVFGFLDVSVHSWKSAVGFSSQSEWMEVEGRDVGFCIGCVKVELAACCREDS